MNSLDMRTVIFLSIITYIICTLFAVQLWRQSRNRFAGMAFWIFTFALQAAALVLIVLRGVIPDWVSIVVANTMIIGGAIAGYMGLERFFEKKGPQVHNYLLVVLYIGAYTYATFVHPDLHLRILILSVGMLIIFLQYLWFLWYRVEAAMRPLIFDVTLVCGGYCVLNIVRIAEYFIGAHAGGEYLQSGAFQTLVLVSYLILLILLTYSLVLMVNKRLLMEIGAQEEKFFKAFHSAPYAITLTRLSDGTVTDVNEGFVAITGYDRAEVLGRKTMDLGLWEDREDRAAVIQTLSKAEKVKGLERCFRKKNGEAVTGLFSAEIIVINGEQHVLSSIADITERKRAESQREAAIEALKSSESRYRELSIVDGLTQLYNSRHFYVQLKMETDRANRYKQPLTLLMLDLDNFKVFNDTYGHVEGDQVLSRLGLVVKRCLRETDSAYRYGGEEFTIVLPMTTKEAGAVTAERIRTEFKKESFVPAPDEEVHMTVSIGLAQHKPQEEIKSLIKRADQFMYRCKENGKDRVCCEP
ncbi:MAG: sensor domain-containing diguanylate cyclase [Syntrophales bacterium]|nr:sensor domain-containing diguanylate cyclase [Syntrophales bacterium]